MAGLVELLPMPPLPTKGFLDALGSTRSTLIVVEASRVWSLSVAASGELLSTVATIDGAVAATWCAERLWISAGFQLWSFSEVERRSGGVPRPCFLPQEAFSIGQLDVTDLVPGGEKPIICAALLDCLARAHDNLSIEPVWVPPWIDSFRPETRSYLTGATVGPDGRVVITSAAMTTEPKGWLPSLEGSGVVVDRDGSVLASGLSLPRQPRYVGDDLVIIESAAGTVRQVGGGEVTPISTLPGVLSSAAALDEQHLLVGHGAASRATVTGLSGGMNPEGDALCDRITLIAIPSGRVVGELVFEGYSGPITSMTLIPGRMGAEVVSPAGGAANALCAVGDFRPLF